MQKHKDVRNIPDGDPQRVEVAFRVLKHKRDALQKAEAEALQQLLGWSVIEPQKAIAKRLGVSAQYLNDILKARRAITSGVVERFLSV